MEEEQGYKFGHEMKKHFQMRLDLIPLNHGGYGAVPKCVSLNQKQYMEEMEFCPDIFFEFKLREYWKASIEEVSLFVGTKSKDTVLVNNATTGINTVLKSLKYNTGEVILFTNCTYHAVKNTCQQTSVLANGVEAVHMSLVFPIKHEDDIVNQYAEYLDAHKNVKIAVIDHITSPTAMLMPVSRIASVCHDRGVLVVVDGAHCPGQLDLNIERLGVDFYTGNLHKWGFSARGCAVLWIDPKFHNVIRPLITSHHWNTGKPMIEFTTQGTNNYSSYQSVPQAIKFYKDIGGHEAIDKYNRSLLAKAVDYLTEKWGTCKLDIPASMEAPFLRLVKLPPIAGFSASTDDSGRLRLKLLEEYKLIQYIFPVQGELFIRLSCQVYNEISDYESLGDAIQELSKRT